MLWRLKLLGALLLVGAAVFASAFQLGRVSQRQLNAVQQLQSDIKAERERVKDDAKQHNLSDYDFCIESLRRRGVRSVAECEQLRGLPAE